MAERPLVLVTGAARRIGSAIALELARAGCDLALHCRHSVSEAHAVAEQVRALGAFAQVFVADLADEVACRTLLPAVLVACGRLDALVNNASLFEYDDVCGFGFAAMERHARVNTGAALLLMQALHTHLSARGATGCAVNLLDQKLVNPNPDYLSYTLSKAALAAAVPMLALALAPTLRVCAVSPGITLPTEGMSAADFTQAQGLTPLQHGATPGDIACAVRYLIESPAVTGTTLLVDGGQHLVAQPRDVKFLTGEGRHG